MKAIAAVTFTALLTASQLRAQTTVTTEPVGFNTVTCLPNSDTIVAVPFATATEFQGALSAVPTIAGGTATLYPTGTVNWTVDAYKTLYYVRFISGAKSGMYYQITANAAGTVTVDLAGDTLTGITGNESFKICKFWTLGTLFPPATQTTFVPSDGTLGFQRKSELMIVDSQGQGINLAIGTKYYVVGTNWLKVGDGTNPANDTILWPDSQFTVRHQAASITAATTFTSVGTAETTDFATPLSTLPAGPQDNYVTHGRPVPVKLSELDLSASSFLDSDGTLGFQRRDQILLYDNTSASINRAPVFIYYRVAGTWYRVGDSNPHNDDTIPPGVGFVIRKYQSGTGATTVWNNNPY